MNELGTVNHSLERNSEYALTRCPDLVLGDYQYVIQERGSTDGADFYVVSQFIIPFRR